MKAPNGHVVTPKVLEKIEAEAAKTIKMREKIAELQNKLYEISMENSWLNYLNEECWEGLSDEEQRRLSRVIQTINKATNRI